MRNANGIVIRSRVERERPQFTERPPRPESRAAQARTQRVHDRLAESLRRREGEHERLRIIQNHIAELDENIRHIASQLPMSSLRRIAQQRAMQRSTKPGDEIARPGSAQNYRTYAQSVVNGPSDQVSHDSDDRTATTDDGASYGSCRSGQSRRALGRALRRVNTELSEPPPSYTMSFRDLTIADPDGPEPSYPTDGKLFLYISPRVPPSPDVAEIHLEPQNENITPSSDSTRACDEKWNVAEDEESDSALYD